jgi:hypothetical protein
MIFTNVTFHRFLTAKKAVSKEDAIRAISKALREIDILKSLGLPLNTSCSTSVAAALKQIAGDRAYPNDVQFESQLKEILSGQLQADDIENAQREKSTESSIQEGQSLPEIGLQDIAYKFAVSSSVGPILHSLIQSRL